MRGRSLTEEQKVFLLTRLACHKPLAAVLAGFRAEFGEAIDRRKAHHYVLARSTEQVVTVPSEGAVEARLP